MLAMGKFMQLKFKKLNTNYGTLANNFRIL